MKYSVYSAHDFEEKADFYILIPVTIQEVIIEKKMITEDFICAAVKRLKKQDREMPRGEIADKLLQSDELIDTILDRIKNEEPDSDSDVIDKNTTKREARYVVFNHVTGLVLRKLLTDKDLKEVFLTNGVGTEDFEMKSMHGKAFVLNRSLFMSNNLTDGKGNISPEVKRLFTEVDPDIDSEDFGCSVVDIYPNGRARDAYILIGITWLRFSSGNSERIKENAWEIRSLLGGNRTDAGMRDKLLGGTTEAYKAFQAALGEQFKWLSQKTRYKVADDNQKLDALNVKWSLGFDADLRDLLNERQEAVSDDKSGVIQKIYGIIEREFLALLNRETKSQKSKIRDAVKGMSRTWQASVKKLFDYAGLAYSEEYFGYFATVTGSKIHNMLFEERQAEFGTSFIALLVKQSFTGDYAPIKRLASEYRDFIVEFDNLDLQERRNKEKHEGLESDSEGAIRLAGKLEKSLFGINLVEELGFIQSEHKSADSFVIAETAAKLRIPEDTELYKRFAAAYDSYLLCDSKFYPDCENVLVNLYNEAIRKNGRTAETDKATRNELVIKHLTGAGFEHTEVMNLTLLKSRTDSGGNRLLAQAFLELIVSSGGGDKSFIKLLTGKKYILQLVNRLYEAVSHNGEPFEQKQCAQFLELIEDQLLDISKLTEVHTQNG